MNLLIKSQLLCQLS